MANELDKAGSHDLAKAFADRLRSGIAVSRASTPLGGGGKPLLKLQRTGDWVIGQQDEEAQIGAEWAVNPRSLGHGYVCWAAAGSGHKNPLLGQVMASVLESKPPMPEPIAGGTWSEQRSAELKCLNGEDEGLEVLFKTNSDGGLKCFDALMAAITARIDDGEADSLVAIVQLNAGWYDHKSYGKTFFPVLDIVGWADMDGNRVGKAKAKPALAAVPPKQPAKPAKPPLNAAPAQQATVDPDDVLPEVEAGVVQPQRAGAAPRRQRPSARA